MAATERAVFPAGTVGTSAANNATQAVTVVAGDVVEAQVVVSAGTDTGMTVACTLNGVAGTALGAPTPIHSNGQTAGFMQVFYWLSPTTGNAVATVSGGTPDSVGIKVRAVAGSDGNAPTYTTFAPSGTGTTTAASCTSPTMPTGSLGISHFAAGTSFSSTGQTTDLNDTIGGASAATAMCGATAAGSGGTTNFTATISAADWYGAIVTVWAQAGAAAARVKSKVNNRAAILRASTR